MYVDYMHENTKTNITFMNHCMEKVKMYQKICHPLIKYFLDCEIKESS